MSALGLSAITFASIFCAALLATYFRAFTMSGEAELDPPFAGLMIISDAPPRHALAPL